VARLLISAGIYMWFVEWLCNQPSVLLRGGPGTYRAYSFTRSGYCEAGHRSYYGLSRFRPHGRSVHVSRFCGW